MTTTLLTHLHIPIYKIIPHSPSIFLLSTNKIIEFNLLTNTSITHTITEFETILDLTYHNHHLYLAGIGHPLSIYSLTENRIIQTLNTQQTTYSAISIKDNTLYCANLQSEILEIWKDNTLLHSHPIGTFIKQLLWQENTLLIAAAESEDAGYLLLYQLDEQNQLHPLDVYVDCHFSISNITLAPDQSELLISGGFPPLNIQIHSYPHLTLKKEIMLAKDYSKDQFGNEIGFAFNFQYQPINQHELLFPYTDGAILLINCQTNKYQTRLETGETWIFTQFINNTLISITAEGSIYLVEEHNFTPPVSPPTLTPPPFQKTNKPLSSRHTIDPNDDPEDLTS